MSWAADLPWMLWHCGQRHLRAELLDARSLGSARRRPQRLGLLSNTSDIHWQFFGTGRYWFVPDVFETMVLSYRVKLMKPDRRIFLHAAELAGVRPEEVFYVDDMPQHVAGARCRLRCRAVYDDRSLRGRLGQARRAADLLEDRGERVGCSASTSR